MKTKKKKLLTTGLAVALAAMMLIGGGTFAYLQANTENTVNAFSTNNVEVKIAETTGDNYNIVPGTEQSKDPKVTATATVDAYVYVEVTDKTDGLVTYDIADGWIPLKDTSNIYYREIVADDKIQGISVLKNDKVKYSSDIGNSDMLDADGNLKSGLELTFKAYAAQKAPFNDPVKAFYQTDTVVETPEALAEAINKAENGDTIAVNNE